jgi:hypothetical protein
MAPLKEHVPVTPTAPSSSASPLSLAGFEPELLSAGEAELTRVDVVLQAELIRGRLEAHGDPQRTAGAALADDDADHRHAEAAHLAQVDRDALGLPALLGTDAGIGARRVDERDDRQLPLLGQPHLLHRLAVALRVRAAEVAGEAVLDRLPLAMADQQEAFAAHRRQPGDDGAVVTEHPVAVQFD